MVLYKGGRLPAWDAVPAEVRDGYSLKHVQSQRALARKHGLKRLEGFRLITSRQPWDSFWIIEMPSLEGAEAWITGGMSPPYGDYGYYEYNLARRVSTTASPAPARSASLPPFTPKPESTWPPVLVADLGSVVLLQFEGRQTGGSVASRDVPDSDYVRSLESVAVEHGLLRLETFHLIDPQGTYRRVKVIEFPELQGTEAWIRAELEFATQRNARHSFTLARKWSPEYFARWVPGSAGDSEG